MTSVWNEGITRLFEILLYTTLAGAAIPVGGLIARIEHLQSRWLERELRHFIIAMGGGIMLAAVALVLIPEGIENTHHPLGVILAFAAGGGTFFWIERLMGVHKNEKPQLFGMLLDYLPESLALGGMFAVGASSAPLLALFIGLQNIPEGFNAYRELRSVERYPPRKVLLLMLALVPLGPFLALFGWFVLAAHEVVLGVVMLFAAGGILYLIFQDIAPQSRLARHWAPPLGAIVGFGIGLLGHLVIR